LGLESRLRLRQWSDCCLRRVAQWLGGLSDAICCCALFPTRSDPKRLEP